MTKVRPSDIIDDWVSQPDISARSVLVSIFGDTVLPVTSSFFLAQLFSLTEVFGFSQRLVRTSMFRLSAEDWFTSERVGRQSRYTATHLAISESEQASERIYGSVSGDWTETPWTLTLLDPALSSVDRDDTVKHLTWNGFFRVGQDLLGSPVVTPGDLEGLSDLLPDGAIRAVVTGRFEDLGTLLTDGFFSQGFDTEVIELDYKAVLSRYLPLADQAEQIANGSITGDEAFALRTMLVHDLRRIKLRSPDLPASLHSPNWAGVQAHELACELYPALSTCAASTLGKQLGIDYPKRFDKRFAG